MKHKDINTGINVPTEGRYNYSDNDRKERAAFEAAMVKYLELPENWADFFQFRGTDDFITLQERGSYKTEAFRRFKRRNQATIQADLKERLMNHIEQKLRYKDAVNDKQKREESYREILEPFISQNSDKNEWRISYHQETKGLEITLRYEMENWRNELEMREIAETYIRHTGEIEEPQFPISIRYHTTIKAAQAFLDEYRPFHDKIMAKAQEIKSQLPTEFFTPETVTAQTT